MENERNIDKLAGYIIKWHVVKSGELGGRGGHFAEARAGRSGKAFSRAPDGDGLHDFFSPDGSAFVLE